MEMDVIERDNGVVDAVDAAVDHLQQARLFRFSAWLHVGPGADKCEAVDEAKGEVSCSDPRHFHAWCRLPNQFQHKEIRERAMAAKARRARQLRDPDSDSGTVLEEELDGLRRGGDTAKQAIVDELLDRDWLRDWQDAQAEVMEEQSEDAPDGEEPRLRWEHITRDKERLKELEAMPEDERAGDEYNDLVKTVHAFNEKVQAAFDERRKPARGALESLALDQLVEQLRDLRIDVESNQEFQHFYEIHEWLGCTLKAPGGAARFADLAALEQSAPEVVEALTVTYTDLERSVFQARAEGNS